MSKHTPGPWTGTLRGGKAIPLRAHHCEALGFSVCFVSDDRDGAPEANARLIAAAPDLLNALQHIAGSCEGRAAEVARAAIAKAEGNS
jgi:hypothetical protein